MTIECNERVRIAPTPIGLDGIWEFRFEEGKSIEEMSDPGFAATDAMAVPGCFDTLPKWYLKRGTALYRRAFPRRPPPSPQPPPLGAPRSASQRGGITFSTVFHIFM